MSVSVSADASGEGWELKDGVLTVTGKFELKGLGSAATDYEWYEYRASITKVIVKGSAEQIPGRAFTALESLTEVVVEEGVTVIDCDAFAYRKITDLYLPASLTTINQGAFIGATVTNLHIPYFSYGEFTSAVTMAAYNDGLTPKTVVYTGDADLYTLEDGVLTVLADVAYTTADQYPWYSKAAEVEKVVLADGVTLVGSNAFSRYANLVEVVLPDSVTTIEMDAFAYLPNAITMTIPATVTTIGQGSVYRTTVSKIIGGFANPEDLYAIAAVKDYNTAYKAAEYEFVYEGVYTLEDGVLTVLVDMSYNTAAEYPWYNERMRVTTAVFAEGLSYIGVRAVEGFPNMKTVIVSNGITEIKGDAFAQNPNLENIVIPNTVATIAGGVMYGSNGNIKNVYSNFANSVEFAKVWSKGAYNGAFGTEADAIALGFAPHGEQGAYTTFWYSKDAKFVYVDDINTVTDVATEVAYAGTQDSATENAIRFVGVTNTLDFVKVGMIISTKAADGTIKSWDVEADTVFTTLKGGDEPYSAEEGTYLFGAVLTGIPAGEFTFSVLPYAETADGIVVGNIATINVTVTENGSTVA